MEEEYNGYLIVVDMGCMRKIKAKGKGSVVKELRGLYTSVPEVKRAIDTYIETKGKVNGKAKSAS